jgi:tetratricopeptide (TPR) repeat protein
MVEGRWPGKRAVRLDQMPLESRPHQIENRKFSVETWIRHLGGGMRLGGNTESEGTVVAVGDGVWVGWRLVMLYPCNSLVFEIGRPKPQPPVGVASMSRVPPNVWTHVACTWDGQDVRLFINGVLSGQTPYAGDFYPAKSHSKLRIGYVGNGLGSVRFEIDEFAVFDRALTAEEILSHAWFQYPASPDHETRFRDAGEKLMARQFNEARAVYEALAVDLSVPRDLQWLAKLRMAECLREQQDLENALILFSEVASSQESPDSLRSAALLESIMLREGVKPETYQPRQTSLAEDSINHYSLCQSSPEYDRAIDAFRHAQADLNAVHWMTRYDEQIRPVLENRCSKCHNDQQAEGGLSLAKYSNGEKAAEDGFVWEQVAARIHRKEMPPPGHPQLTEAEIMLVEQWAESRPRSAFCEELATEENQRQFQGHVFSRRLNRTEYSNAMRDLLGVSLTESEIPPQDGSGGEGFDTVGDVLFTSTAHVETYLRAAGGAVERALRLDLDLDQSDRSQRRILTVVPQALDPESTRSDSEAARQILATFARRAWRRPIGDIEIDALEKLFQRSLENGNSFVPAITETLQAILVSPNFLFIVEAEPGGAEIQRLNPHQLVTRLALFLWSSLPDDELLAVADSKAIYTDEVLREQVHRMLKDPRARGLGEAFGLQWLALQGKSDRQPDAKIFPDFWFCAK